MSDAESVSSDSTTSSDGNSIYDELEQVLERCEHLHHHIHSAGETLQGLHALVVSGDNIKIVLDGATRDLDEVLEELHASAMSAIQEGKANIFGQCLAAVLVTGVIQ